MIKSFNIQILTKKSLEELIALRIKIIGYYECSDDTASYQNKIKWLVTEMHQYDEEAPGRPFQTANAYFF